MRRTRFFLLSVAVVAVALLAGCNIINDTTPTTYTLTIVNNCGGDDTYVDVYVDGNMEGTVYQYHTYGGVSPGSHSLEAYGTGYYGDYFSRNVNFTSNVTWTLCP